MISVDERIRRSDFLRMFDDVLEKVKSFKYVKRAFPVLGRYDIVVDLEAESLLMLSLNTSRPL